ncbi:MAG: LysR substrate-binding domain-containing protein, partial [Clostridia bacterium]|nr:LysR substrate-binding domain-containing protein [Clostridia bacterium]
QGVEQVQKELNIVAVLNDQQAVIKAIREGLGVSIVSKLAAADFKKSILTFSLEKNYRYLYLVTLKNKFYSSEINNFIKFIRRFYFKNNNK